MEPFDIEKAKAGQPVFTRSGKRVTINDYERMHPNGDCVPVPLLMGTIEGGRVELWDSTGHIREDHVPDPLDLVMKP